MAQHQVLERVIHCVAHFQHVRVIREHQRQFLLEHQRAGRNGRHNVPTVIDHRRQHRNVDLFGLRYRFEISELQLRHAAAHFFLCQRYRYAVVLEYVHKIRVDRRMIAIAIARRIEHNFAARVLGWLGAIA